MRRCFTVLVLLVIPALAIAPTAGAGLITIGSPLKGEFIHGEVEQDFTLMQTALPGAVVRSPVNGVLVRWRAINLDEQGFYRLRVIRAVAGGGYTGVGTGPQTELAKKVEGVSEFSVNLPIQAGDSIGFDVSDESDIGARFAAGASFDGWQPFLGDGLTHLPTFDSTKEGEGGEPAEIGFNADVLPAPAITAVTPTNGSYKGGTKVAIEGSDLSRATAVTIGGAPATFSVESEAKLTAVAPPVQKPAAAAISVTTPAGTAVATPTFAYEACEVPKLKGKKPKAVRKTLKKAHCKLGKVNRVKGGSGKVTKQAPAPRKLLAPGSRVRVTLG